MEADNDHCLHLSSNKINFKGGNKSGLTNVFFDESNIQVFSVVSGDVTEVEVKSPYKEFCRNFKMEEKGRVVYIKFSRDQKILALQRTQATIEFLIFNQEGNVSSQLSETFKSCRLIGYTWTLDSNLVVITSIGIRLYKLDTNLQTKVILLKNINISNITWATYYSPAGLCLVKTGLNDPVHLLQYKQQKISSVAKFDLYQEFRGQTESDDVVLGIIYNKPRILFMNYENKTEVIIRTLLETKDCEKVKVTNVLKIHEVGRFGLNIVDNLVVVHNQMTKCSLIFDITDAPFNGTVIYHDPVVKPQVVKHYQENETKAQYEMYSPNWAIFQPNIIMDAKAGCLWGLEVNLNGFYSSMKNRNELIKLLLLRRSPEAIITKTLLEVASQPTRLEELAKIFSQINSVYRLSLERNLRNQFGIVAMAEEDNVVDCKTVIDQNTMDNVVFCKLAEEANSNQKLARNLSWVLLEYIKSLTDYQIPVQYFINNKLINCLNETKDYFQLHQLLQYHVISDSKPVACHILSLENVYPGASQLALDMLSRLGTAKEEIKEILLTKQQVLAGLRYAREHSDPVDIIKAEKYLEAAKPLKDPRLDHAIKANFEAKPCIFNTI